MKANTVNSIKNLLSNKLANTHFASPTQNHIITDSLAEILAQELPNPSKISFIILTNGLSILLTG